MNKLEKVIKGIEEAKEYFRECRSNASIGSKAEKHFWELQNAASEAAELLKAQEPVHVKYLKMKYGKWLLAFCGNCDEQIREDWKCCPVCGKAVKWD